MAEDLMTSIVDSIAEGVYIVDRDRRIGFWNKGAERITGYARAEVVGSRCSDNILRHVDGSGCELCEDGCPLLGVLEDGKVREVEVYLHHKAGHRVPVGVRGSPLWDESGRIAGAIEIFVDHSERSGILSELERARKESLTDPLTGLGNRRFLDLELEGRMAELEANGLPFGFIIADIDFFKRVNDERGHDAGDRVLKMVAATISSSLRRFDAAARWGGEEFAVVVPNADQGLLRTIAERMRSLVERSWIETGEAATGGAAGEAGGRAQGGRLAVTVSAGGALARKGEPLEALLARADGRLYECKRGGRNRVLVGD